MIDALVVSVDSSCDLPEKKIKPIIDILDDAPVVSDEMIKLAFWMRERYICKYSDAIRLMIPAMIKYEHNIIFRAIGSEFAELTLNEKENELLQIIKEGPVELLKLKKAYGGSDIFTILRSLKEKGMIESESREQSKSKSAYEKYVSLYEDKALDEYDINGTEKQVRIINFLKENKKENVKKLSEDLNVSNAVINNLIKKNILKEEYILYSREEQVATEKPAHLNEEQQKACDEIISSDSRVFLLHGVTGSGKTEVYMNIIEHYIKQGKQSIMLVPEISLTTQTIDRFQKRFGNKIAVFHSRLSKKEKFIEWTKVYNHEVDVVIGARSAIFAPIKNLGVIVIDEEHEDS